MKIVETIEMCMNRKKCDVTQWMFNFCLLRKHPRDDFIYLPHPFQDHLFSCIENIIEIRFIKCDYANIGKATVNISIIK